MNVKTTERGFRFIDFEKYASDPPTSMPLVQESSIIGEYDDAFDKPGSSALWIGKDHHLNREEVAELILHLQVWLDTGRLTAPASNAPATAQ